MRLINRYSCKCKLCKAKWTTDEPDHRQFGTDRRYLERYAVTGSNPIMRTILARKGQQSISLTIPTSDDVTSLCVGDIAEDCFGKPARVVEIFAQREDINGVPFVCVYLEFGSHGSTISDSYKANSIHRTTRASSLFTSAELDALERPFKIPSAHAMPLDKLVAVG